MPVYVSDLFTATPASVNATPTSTRTWQWLRGSSAISGATSDTYTAVTADIGSTLSATQLETNFLATTTATSAATEVVQAFDPIRLFSASEPGVWYDPTDMSTLYQNAAGTIPVTSFGQPVGLMLDKSRGLVLGPELITNGDFTSSTGWIVSPQCSISDGAANLVSADGTYQSIARGSFSVVAGKFYKVSVTITRWVSGTLRMQHSGGLTAVNFPAAVGTYEAIVVAAGTTSASLYFDRAGGVTDLSIDNISIKELPGLHATQSTEASRPLYGIVPVSGRRNLLTQTEDLSNAAWIYQFSTRNGLTTAPDGTSTAQLITFNAQYGNIRQLPVYITAGSATNGVWIKRISGNTQIQLRGDNSGGAQYVTNINITDSWVFYSASWAHDGTNDLSGLMLQDRNASGQGQIAIWHPQFEASATPTAYQRVSTDLDVTEAGVASVGYLRFDGSTSWMLTPTITPGTDKVQVFAGVRKLSDAATAVLVEYSASIDTNNGTLLLTAPSSNGADSHKFSSKGTVLVGTGAGTFAVAPVTSVLTGLGDISGDVVTLRRNGTQVAQTTTDQGTGNYLAYPLYIGRRAGSTLPFNGYLFPLIVRFGPNLTAARIAATEAWVATKTGGVTL